MEEAEILCDRVAIMEKGKIIIIGKTHKLIEKTKYPLKVEFILGKVNSQTIDNLKSSCRGDCYVKKLPGKEMYYEAKIKYQQDLNNFIGSLQKENPESLSVRRSTLEDLFIELTGKTIKEVEEKENNV